MNKIYSVLVTEILERTVEITASSENEALEKAYEMWSSGEIDLDYRDHVDVSYQVAEA